MTIKKDEAIEIARSFVASAPWAVYPIKPGYFSAELRNSDSFSRSLGVDCLHWVITLEYLVPGDVVMSPDEITVLVAETSGEVTLATLM